MLSTQMINFSVIYFVMTINMYILSVSCKKIQQYSELTYHINCRLTIRRCSQYNVMSFCLIQINLVTL